jgi:tartrate dehydrogenase/decarboxylase/D-malate dehydrogenase
MVLWPGQFDVIVASNLFGDILTEIGAAIQGGLGYAASANINPDRSAPSMFEPVHGSAPDIAHLGTANPIAAIWSGAMMLEHLGESVASSCVMKALEETTARGIGTIVGQDKTDTITAAVVAALS